MKKLVIFLMVCILGLSLNACGENAPKYVKSEEAINVEKQINALSAASSYKDIYNVHCLYIDLSYEDKENLENKETLSHYCEPSTGHFILNEEMLDEIESEFEMTALKMTGVELSVSYGLIAQQMIKDWSDFGNYRISSYEQTDDYTYTIYGTAQVEDKYGSVSTVKYNLEYFAIYDEETTSYIIDSDFNFVG